MSGAFGTAPIIVAVGYRQPPIIFLVAGPKGRSPVSRLLDTHKHVVLAPDSAWMTTLAAQRRTFEVPGGAKLFAEAFVEHRTASAWGFTLDELLDVLDAAEASDYTGFVRAVVNAFAARNHAHVVVDASPHVAANLHLLTLLIKRARILVIKEPELTVEAPVETGYAEWFDGRTAIEDATSALERTRLASMRLEDLLMDPVGSVKTLVAYLETGLGLDGFSKIEGLAVATKPGTMLRRGPQSGREPAPLRWLRAFLERYPGLARKLRAWSRRNQPLVNRTMKKLRKAGR